MNIIDLHCDTLSEILYGYERGEDIRLASNDLHISLDKMEKGGYALTNLRVGHIVAIVDHRIVDGERQLLIIDSARDSMNNQVRGNIAEVIPQSRVCARFKNLRGVVTFEGYHYAMFWVKLEQTSDFDLLHKI